MKIKKIYKYLLDYCSTDYMGLWVIVWNVTHAHTSQNPREIVQKKTLKVIEEMLKNGWIEIGVLILHDAEVNFQPLKLSVKEAINYINSEWELLGREPDIGEVCWFRATPAGIQLSNELRIKD